MERDGDSSLWRVLPVCQAQGAFPLQDVSFLSSVGCQDVSSLGLYRPPVVAVFSLFLLLLQIL